VITAAPTPKPTGIAAVEPCTVVTSAQLQQIFGRPLSEGLPNVQARGECDYGGPGSDGISVAVGQRTFDAGSFQAYLLQEQQVVARGRPEAVMVPAGVGEAAATMAVAQTTGSAASIWVLEHGLLVTVSCSFAGVSDPKALVPKLAAAARAALPEVLKQAGA